MKKGGSGLISILRYFCLFVIVAMGTIAIVGLSGCGGGGGGGGDDDDNVQSLKVTGESGNQVNLNGTWEGECDPDFDDGESDIWEVTFSGSSITVTQLFWFTSTNCTGTRDAIQVLSGTATIGDEVTVSFNGPNVTATETDYVIDSNEVTLYNPGDVVDFNNDQTCGFDDWQVGVAKEILGSICAPDADEKDVVYVDDTANPDAFYRGDEDEPLDVNGYPTEIDLSTKAERK